MIKSYGSEYFNKQKAVGHIAGLILSKNFSSHVRSGDCVIDFGCGGGFLLSALECGDRIGIEPNDVAAKVAIESGVSVFRSSKELLYLKGESIADVIISNHALEHCLRPFDELQLIYRLLKPGGTVHFIVPCETTRVHFDPKNSDKHLYSWSPQNLGNLFTEIGFIVTRVGPKLSKFPPGYQMLWRYGRYIFGVISLVYGSVFRTWSSVEIIAKKEGDLAQGGLPVELNF